MATITSSSFSKGRPRQTASHVLHNSKRIYIHWYMSAYLPVLWLSNVNVRPLDWIKSKTPSRRTQSVGLIFWWNEHHWTRSQIKVGDNLPMFFKGSLLVDSKSIEWEQNLLSKRNQLGAVVWSQVPFAVDISFQDSSGLAVDGNSTH